MKLVALVLSLGLAPITHAACLENLGQFQIGGKPLSSSFLMEEKELKSLPKPGNKILALTFKPDHALEPKAEELLYYKTLYVYDKMLKNRRCPASVSRVFFVFPRNTVTISTKDLARIRKVKDRPKWQAYVYVRSQVVHGKN
jgi:hypothetical protein